MECWLCDVYFSVEKNLHMSKKAVPLQANSDDTSLASRDTEIVCRSGWIEETKQVMNKSTELHMYTERLIEVINNGDFDKVFNVMPWK